MHHVECPDLLQFVSFSLTKNKSICLYKSHENGNEIIREAESLFNENIAFYLYSYRVYSMSFSKYGPRPRAIMTARIQYL